MRTRGCDSRGSGQHWRALVGTRGHGSQTLEASPTDSLPAFEPVDHHSTLPLFLQVVDRFESALRTGRLRAGQMLPSEADLCAQLGVSRKTLRRATDHLARLTLIRRMQGVGTVVAEEARVDGLSARRSLHADLLSARRIPESRILSQTRAIVDVAHSQRTGFHVGTELLHLRRLRLAEGKPYAILEDLVPTLYLSELAEADADRSFLELLRRKVRPSALIRQEIEARLPTEEQAALLGIAATTPLLRETICRYDDMGEIFHHGTSVYHPVNYRMTTVTLPDPNGRPDQPRSAAAGD